jgi:hypothetical protein
MPTLLISLGIGILIYQNHEIIKNQKTMISSSIVNRENNSSKTKIIDPVPVKIVGIKKDDSSEWENIPVDLDKDASIKIEQTSPLEILSKEPLNVTASGSGLKVYADSDGIKVRTDPEGVKIYTDREGIKVYADTDGIYVAAPPSRPLYVTTPIGSPITVRPDR